MEDRCRGRETKKKKKLLISHPSKCIAQKISWPDKEPQHLDPTDLFLFEVFRDMYRGKGSGLLR